MRRSAKSRRIALFVEGDTEQQTLPDFFHRWLDPQLPTDARVGIHAVKFKGSGDYLQKVADRVELYLSQRKADFVVGVVDLYGLPSTIDFGEAASIKAKVLIARKQIKQLVPAKLHKQFRQHFAVHEVEAWMLAYPEKFPADVRTQLSKRPPEQVNFNEPPAKLLSRLIRGYKKTVMGRNILRDADPQTAIDKCPYLKLLADDLLALARVLV